MFEKVYCTDSYLYKKAAKSADKVEASSEHTPQKLKPTETEYVHIEGEHFHHLL